MTGPNAEPQAQELSFQEKTQWCLDNLGQRISAVGTGVSDASKVRNWAAGELAGVEHQQRIDLLYAVGKEVADVYDAETARAFVRSSNDFLGDESVLEAIADTLDPEEAKILVRGAVDSFLK